MKADNADANDSNLNVPDYFRSNTSRTADKRANQVLIKKIHNELSKNIFGNSMF